MLITDSGLHIWREPTPERPWMPGRTAHLPEPIGYENLRERMLEAGVQRAILIPPSWEGVMMNVPTVLTEDGEVAARHPNLRIIIDHMGRLRGMKDETLRLDKTIALAKYPNVHVKLTLISECTSAEYPYKNIQPEVRRLIDAFSPRRSFWGTDLSVMLSRSTCTYKQAATLFTEEMGYSKEDQAWILGRGLAECLPWPINNGWTNPMTHGFSTDV